MSKKNWTEEICRSFLARNIELGSPACDKEVQQFCVDFGNQVDQDILRVYQTFNGFDGLAEFSSVSLWSLDDILKARNNSISSDNITYFPFADFLIHSHVYYCSFVSIDDPIWSDEVAEPIAKSFRDFLEGIADGRFDV